MYFDKRYVPFLSYKYLIKILFTFFLWKYTIKYVPIHSIFESEFDIKNYSLLKLTKTLLLMR